MAAEKDFVIRVSDASVRFNMASEKIDNLKEYFVKLVKRNFCSRNFCFEGCKF